jgi:hypothetical protein
MSPLASVTLAVLAFGSAASAQLLFGPAKTTHPLPSNGQIDSVGAADVDGDGRLDLVRASGLGIYWNKGDGTGAFVTTGTLVPGITGDKIRLVDLNGDGRRDLLTVTPQTTTLQVALARASGFDPPVEYPTPIPPFSQLEIRTGDADADGDADVLVLAPALTAPAPGAAWLMLNDGEGTLIRGPIVAGDATHVLEDGLVASVDGDSEPDLVLVSNSVGQPAETTVWQGQPGGGVAAGFRVQGHKAMSAADLDADGDLDLVGWTHPPNPSNAVSTFLGDGRGGFAAGAVIQLGTQAEDMDLADFDDDGLPDLVVVLSLDESAWWLRGDGGGGFSGPQARVTLQTDLDSSRFAALDDFDLDGRPDVLIDELFHDKVMVAPNATYPAGGPLLDRGHQLEHSTGWPILIASGSFAAGEPFAFDLFRVPFFKPIFPVMGFSVLEAPFKGGTMVPTPQIVVGSMPSGGSGELHLTGDWPLGMPSGSTIAVQFWFSASGTIAGFAASSGVRITTP